MSALTSEPQADAEGIVETPSGKGRGGENFPVGSLLIRRGLRVHVHAFYRFARNADDIADNPALASADKIRRLDRMAAVLDGAPGDDAPTAAAMRQSLLATGTTAQHCRDVLRAFRQDAEQAALPRLGRADGILPLFGGAGRPAIARPARREPGGLARLRRALRRPAGAEPSAGLRRRLPPARPGLPAARRPRRCRSRGRGAGDARPRARDCGGCSTRSSTAPPVSSPRRGDCRAGSRLGDCGTNAR